MVVEAVVVFGGGWIALGLGIESVQKCRSTHVCCFFPGKYVL